MALILSAATGNFNSTATWVGGVVPTTGDEARASTGHTITITANATCTEISNAGTGIYTLNDGITLTANVTNKTTTGSRNCLQFTAASPAVGSIVGNCTGGITQACGGVNNSSTGTLIVTGNCVGGSGSSGSVILGCFGVSNASTGTVTVTGNCTGGSGASSHGIQNASTGSISITGNLTGGTSTGYGAYNNLSGTLTVTGNVTGGTLVATSHGLNNASTGIVAVTGICTGGAAGAAGANNASTGTVRATRSVGNAYGPANSAGLVASVGVSNAALGICEIEQIEFGTFGQMPVSGTGIRLKKTSSNVAIFNYADTAGAKTLIDATANAAMPAATDVRNGVSYASGALTGSAFIPSASSVASGVPVGSGTGTAVLTAAAIRTELAVELARIDAAVSSAGNAPTAVQIRTEMDSNSTKLANLDATISSRLAPSGTLATVTTLTNAPTVPTASAIATQVRTELATELARVDVATSTRLASSAYTAPANTDVAAIKAKTDNLPSDPADQSLVVAAITAIPTVAQIRTELDSNSTKLANLDTTVSSRLASSVSTNITAIKAKTDLLNTDRLAQCATTSIVGSLIAQSNS